MVLIEYIKKYKVTYISVVITFIIGLILGIFVTFKIPSKDKIEINNYLQELSEKITEGKVDRSHLFKEKLADNIKYLGIVWLLGCTVIAGFTIYILMGYKGFLFGYITTIVIKILGFNDGAKILFPTIILKNILFLPIVFLLATSGIRMNKGIVKREINIKIELIRHTFVMIISLLFTIIVSCIDAYSSVILLHFL